MIGARPTLLIILALVAGLTLSGCSEPEQPPLRLGTVVWPGYEPLYLARTTNELPESLTRLIEYPSASEVIRALRNRSLEAAALTLDEVLTVAGEHTPLKVILVMDISAGGDVILAHPDIAGMADLHGKRIGVESSALGAFMLTRALQSHGLTLDDVLVKHMDVNAQESAFHAAEIDAMVTYEPMRTRLLQAGARELFSSREIPGEIVDVLVVHQSVLDDRADELKRLVDIWFDSLDYLEQQPEEAARIIAQRLKITPEQVRASYDGLVLPSRVENQQLLGGPQPVLRTTIQRLNQVLVDARLLTHPASGSDLIDGSLVK